MYGVNDGTRDLKHFWNIAEKSCAGSFASHFFNRTTEIYVDEIGLCLLNDDSCIAHGFGFTTVNLNSNRPFLIVDGEFTGCGGYVSNEGVGVNELGINAIRPVPFTEHSEGRIGYVLHGSEEKGVIFHFSRNHVIT
jgi:hypothetical protein